MFYIILPGLTKNDIDDNFADDLLKNIGWNKDFSSDNEQLSKYEIIKHKQTPLIYKGHKQGILAGKLLSLHYPNLIITSSEQRCLETRERIIEGLDSKSDEPRSFKNLRVLETSEFDSRDLGLLADLEIFKNDLKSFTKITKSKLQKKIISLYQKNSQEIGVENKKSFRDRIRQAMITYRATIEKNESTVLIADKDVVSALIKDNAIISPLYGKKLSAGIPILVNLERYVPYIIADKKRFNEM